MPTDWSIVDFLAPAKKEAVLFRAVGPRAERYEGGFMTKEGPTVIFDPNFVLDRSHLLNFIVFCIAWAKILHNIVGRISIRFVFTPAESNSKESSAPRQRAEFMWAGNLIVQIYPTRIDPDNRVLQFVNKLTDNFAHCTYVEVARFWEDLFVPNLRCAISREIEKLTKLAREVETKTFPAEEIEPLLSVPPEHRSWW